MKRIFNKFGSSKLIIILAIVLQIVIIILIINPFAIISQNQINSILNEVVQLSNDPDFRSATISKVAKADDFRKQYLLGDNFSNLKDNDYILLVNDKFIIFRKDEDKIIYQGVAPSSMLDLTRLALLISQKAKDENLISDSETPAIKFYNENTDKDQYKDYFDALTEGEVLAFFGHYKLIIVYNLQTNTIISTKNFTLN